MVHDHPCDDTYDPLAMPLTFVLLQNAQGNIINEYVYTVMGNHAFHSCA